MSDVLFTPALDVIAGVGLALSALAILTAICLAIIVIRSPAGSPKMKEIAHAIEIGARAFLAIEYLCLLGFVLVIFAVIAALIDWRTGLCYLVGSFLSALTGALGMLIATKANVRTCAAAQEGLANAMRVAFNSGSVMGLSVVGFSLGGLSLMLMIFRGQTFTGQQAITGFGMGATSVSLFSRVGGGIFTKAADVGADMVGKVEMSIPEDDPRNPATIADNVGDNVGDIAGMGADLFGSFAGSIIAASLLGFPIFGLRGIAYPFWIACSGILCSMVGMALVRCRNNATAKGVLRAFRRGLLVSNLLQIGMMALMTYLLTMPWKHYGTLIIGLAAGHLIALSSEFFTSPTYPAARSIARSATVGPANVIIQGLSVGMMSTVFPTLVIAATILGAIKISGTYGLSLASVGLLSCLAFTLATDAYGPVADNAGGIAEMSELPPEVRERTDLLDALGNTTAAVGKGFAIGSAVLTGLSLLSVFQQRLSVTPFDPISDEFGLSGVVVGGMVPFLFAALTMSAVAQSASSVVLEVRRQFTEHPGIMERTEKPDYARCVRMITISSLHAMILPAMMCVFIPIIFGIAFPATFLAGLLLSQIAAGLMLSMMMAAAGGAWDNAKKYIETGEYGGKHSTAHRAAVVGDTVGDPFKDTSGPAINILIKLSSYTSIVLSPIFEDRDDYWWAAIIIAAVGLIIVALLLGLSPRHLSRLGHHFREKRMKRAASREQGLSSVAVAPAVPGDMNPTLDELEKDEVEMQDIHDERENPVKSPTFIVGE